MDPKHKAGPSSKPSSAWLMAPWAVALAVLIIAFSSVGQTEPTSDAKGPAAKLDPATADVMQAPALGDANPEPDIAPTVDHTKLPQLQVEFKTGPEVTAACLGCHTEAAKQIMGTMHWTWRSRHPDAKTGKYIGKAEHVINNFCIALGSNEPRCTSCHAGYGWKDKNFDFTNETLVDCLVCHDTTKTYRKFPVDAGHPNYEPKEWPKGSGNIWQPADLTYVAQNVGKPARHNCGTCHFFGGGGEGVKHGDMDVSLAMPNKSLDVHMHSENLDFKCTDCHTTRAHQIAGRYFTFPAVDDRSYVMRGTGKRSNLLACESCHSKAAHQDQKLNDHTDKVACQTCHIPTMARERPTKMWWDWSKAGEKDENGKPMVKGGEVKGTHVKTYDTMKGEFIWIKDEQPEYVWFNGKMDHTFFGDKVDDQTPAKDQPGIFKGAFDKLDMDKPIVRINTPYGGYDDPKSRIWPIKVHRGIQPYDIKNKTLVTPKLFPNGADKAEAYWKSYDWKRAVVAGNAYNELPFSGELGWIQTEMTWPLSHMVAPRENAVACSECHTTDGRLAQLTGFYMPGRDGVVTVDYVGWALIAMTLLACVGHGLLRIMFRKNGATS